MPEIDKLNFVMGMNTAGMARGGSAVTRIFGNMDNRFKAVIGTVGIMSAVFVGFAVKAVKAASKFEVSWNEVRTLIDETKVDSELLRSEVLRLAKAVGRPPSEVSRGLYQVISAGVTDAADAMFVLEVATKASIAGMTDQFTAVDAITTVMNAWGLEIKDTTKIADLMFNAVKEGKLTFSDLASNIGQVASTAALAKVSFEEVTAALATMTKAGLSMEESTTALNQLLLQTIKAQDDAKVTAKEFGFELSATALAAKGLVGLMNDIATATEGDIDALIALMPNIRAFRGEAILAGTGLDEFNRILETTTTALGSSEEAFKKVKEGIAETAKELSAKIEVIYIRMGEKIIPALNRALEGTIELFEQITDSEADKIIKAIKDIEGASVLSAQIVLRDKINRILEDQKQLQKDIAMQQRFGAGALLSTLSFSERYAQSSKLVLSVQKVVANQLAIIMEKSNAIVLLEEKRVKFVEDIKVAEVAVALGFIDQNKIGGKALKILEERRDAMKISLKLLDAALIPLKEQVKNQALIVRLEKEIERLRKEGVKDTKKIAKNVKDVASTDLELELTVAFKNIGQTGRVIGEFSQAIGVLSDTSSGAIIDISNVASSIAVLRSAFKDTESSLLDKLVPGLSIVASSLSIISTVFGKTKKQTDLTSDSVDRFAESMRKLDQAFETSIRLRNLTEAQELKLRLDRLLAQKDFFRIPFPDAFQQIGQEGSQAFLDFISIVQQALADGIITEEEARAIDDAIDKMAQIPGLMSLFSDMIITLIENIANLTERFRDLGEAADDAGTDKFKGTGLGRFERFKAKITDEGGGGILDPFLPDNRTVRQFVGITELQGNLVIGILNTSRTIQQSILDLLLQRLGIDTSGIDIGDIDDSLDAEIEGSERGGGLL